MSYKAAAQTSHRNTRHIKEESRPMTEPDPSKVTVVNIMAVSFSGSTWLNLILGSHSKMFGIGEIKSIQRRGRAVCKLHADDCPIWSRFDHQSSENPYLQISRITGKRILVVNNPREFLGDQAHPAIESRFIHLVRDGRAVACSILKRHPERSIWRAARQWVRSNKKKERILARHDPAHGFTVIYERLLADKPAGLACICDFIGVPFEEEMLEYWNRSPHFLGGNKGTLFSLAKMTNTKLPELPKGRPGKGGDLDLNYYDKTTPATFVDERWKTKLSDWQLMIFSVAAGRMNRRYGYTPTLQRT
jgi:hypothetical protein